MDQMTLKEILFYDKDTGDFFWKERPMKYFKKDWCRRSWNTKYAGKKAGVIDSKGYPAVFIMSVQYRLHRLAWLYCYGETPEAIDHINGVRTDNRIINLRSGTIQQNQMNRAKSRNNTSGVTGVYYSKKSKLWCAQMKFNGKTYHLGSSKNIEDAIKLRKQEETKLGFSKRHGL